MQPTAEEPVLQPPLDEYRKQLRVLQDDARGLVQGLSEAQINWSPAPGRWSIAECLDHTDLTTQSYLRVMEPAILDGRAKGKLGGGARYGPFERWFIRSLEPPATRRFKAPKKILPSSSSFAKDEVLARFLADHDSLIDLLVQADGLDLGRVRITSPLLSLLKLRLGAAFALLVAHGRRHIWQAHEVMKSPGFPGARHQPAEE